ncbi:MAG: sigma-70 family RNA polymerase sigma factor [Polyangiales bacterium]
MAELTRALDEVVRRERARVLAALVRLCCGLDDAEDAFHDAVLAAMRAWGDGLPANPGAWLMTAARNRARDVRRHRAVVAARAPMLARDDIDPRDDDPEVVADDVLRLLFTCCHPCLSRENQVALTLKLVAGFSTEQLARAFVTTEDTVSQRVLRARHALAAHPLPDALGAPEDLPARARGVLGVVHAIFTEGHTAARGALQRVDLQEEALRLARLTCDLLPDHADAFGLLALIAFGVARAPARVDDEGVPVLLPAQDRAAWRRPRMREGLMALRWARAVGAPGAYVLQAEIAAQHIVAPTWEATDWPRIVALYDALLELERSPVVELHRAVARAMRDGPQAGLAALAHLEGALSHHHLFYAVRADLLHRAGRDGLPDLRRARELATNDGERRLLERRIRQRA